MAGMKSWSTTAANNVLANTGFTMDEGQAPSTLNDSIRQAMADIRTEWAQGANIASAATVDLSAATGGYVHITGAVTITAFGTVSAGIRRKITFDGALTLTHNATSLILPTGASIVTVAGDTCEAMSEGSGNWRVLWYAGKNVQATTVTASTSVVTPIIQSATTLQLNTNNNPAVGWTILSGGDIVPNTNASYTIGNVSLSLLPSKVYTPIIDTGTTGSGALKTNNGTTVLTWANSGIVTFPLNSAIQQIAKRKTADESVTSSTVLQDDDHLTFAIAANEEWVADFSLNVGSALLNTGIKLAVTVPSGATMSLFCGCFGATQAGASLQTTTGGAALDYTTAAMSPTNRGTYLARLWVLNGATPGNCTLQFAQSTSSGTAVTILKGSDMKAIRVA